jgi:hypothetical protein
LPTIDIGGLRAVAAGISGGARRRGYRYYIVMPNPAVLAELEIVVSRSTGRPEAVFDLAAAQATALQDALVYYRLVRFAGQALDAEMVGQLRALDGLSEQAYRRGDLTAPAVFRVGAVDASKLSEAAALYVADRDVESYQSPEERDRIALLFQLSEALRQVAVDLRAAEAQLADPGREPTLVG